MAYLFRLRRLGYICFINTFNLLMMVLPFSLLRIWLLKMFGAKIGTNTVIRRGVRFDFPWRLAIGNRCFVSEGVYFDCRGGSISIGDGCDISSGSVIYTVTHNIYSEFFEATCGKVVVQSRCWVCSRSILLPGSTLLTGTVLGANSVFSGSSQAYALLVGVPAVSVKTLPATRAEKVRQIRFE